MTKKGNVSSCVLLSPVPFLVSLVSLLARHTFYSLKKKKKLVYLKESCFHLETNDFVF